VQEVLKSPAAGAFGVGRLFAKPGGSNGALEGALAFSLRMINLIKKAL
jgi:hypothetical protein